MGNSYIELSRYFKRPDFSFYDFAACLATFLLIFVIAKLIQTQYRSKPYYRKYFMWGLVFKVFGGLAYALIYTYYYTYGGDTSGYWKFGLMLSQVLFDYPQYWWDVFTANFKSTDSFTLGFLHSVRWTRSTEEYRVVQITSLLAPLGWMNFYATTILLAGICYTGVWRLFLVFRSKFPQSEGGLAVAVLFFPTVVFWGSGIMKDTIVFACLGLLLYAINALFTRGLYQVKHWVMLAFALFLIFSIKPYILFSLAPGLFIWRTFRLRDKIKSKLLRKIAFPLALLLGFVGSLYALNALGRINPLYSLENFIASAESMQNWHYQEGSNTSEQYGRGSSYTLGDYEPTPLGVIKKMPAAINVTLFRPYVWETDTFMQLLSAIESQLLMLVTLYIILKVGIRRFFSTINNDSFLLLMLSFSLIFAFGVGFSAYNFGALARYKIPCIPFFVGLLFIVYNKYRIEKRERFFSHINRQKESRYATA